MSKKEDRVWDGRGDGLSDAQFSTNSGRAADDLRLGALHMRVLLHLGRQNSRRGWVMISQTELAARWGGVSRSRLSVAINDLVRWKYLRVKGQEETGQTFCQYKVNIDDGSEDETFESVPPAEQPDASQGVPDAEHPADGGVPSAEQRCSDVRNTGVPTAGTQYRNTVIPTLPLTPQGAQGGGVKFDWIEALRGDGCAEQVLDHLLLPLLAAGLKPWKDVDPLGPGRQLCEDFKRRSVPVLQAAASALLDTARHRLPPVADARIAVKAAGDIAAAAAMRERQASAVATPEVMRFDRGTPEFAAEVARIRIDDPDWADRVEQRGFVKLSRGSVSEAERAA